MPQSSSLYILLHYEVCSLSLRGQSHPDRSPLFAITLCQSYISHCVIFGCEDAAQQVLMSVCLCVHV